MKLVKIGRSASCNIKLHSEKVSALHAEMLIMDNGDILLEDKNSTNGTFVGNHRINPNEEVHVRRGDYICFADTELNWAYVPGPDSVAGYKKVLNIGTHQLNDIVVNGNFASRFHAVLRIAKDGKAFIRDIGSKNGTIVNGTKIDSNKDVRIKKSDQIVCGDVDVTEELKPFIPDPVGKIVKVASSVLGAAVLALAVLLGVKGFIIPPVQDYSNSVAYVMASYHYTVTFEDNPIPELWDGKISLDDSPQIYQSTAFFIDDDGYLATNRHVAMPWHVDYDVKNKHNWVKAEAHKWIQESLPFDNVRYNDLAIDYLLDADYLSSKGNELALAISGYAVSKAENSRKKFANEAEIIIKRLKNSPLKISGEMDFITLGYRGRYYTHQDEFDRCHVVAESGTYDKDIALLRMNDKKTPEHVTPILEIDRARTDKLKPLEETLYTIGYPGGIMWGQDDVTKSLQPEIRELKCGKEPGKYTFEFQGEAVSGASGSPIFDRKGHLVGVLWGGKSSASTFGLACQAKYLKEMYNDEVGNE